MAKDLGINPEELRAGTITCDGEVVTDRGLRQQHEDLIARANIARQQIKAKEAEKALDHRRALWRWRAITARTWALAFATPITAVAALLTALH